jgi:hypothetical protein
MCSRGDCQSAQCCWPILTVARLNYSPTRIQELRAVTSWAQRAAAPSRNKWEKASRRAGTLNRADRRRAVEQSVRANRHAASSLTPRTVPPTREAFCMKRPRFNESSAKREMPVNAYASLPSAGLHRDARANPRYQIYEWSRIENYPVSLGSRLRGAP